MPRPPTSTLFPYTTLFRSDRMLFLAERIAGGGQLQSDDGGDLTGVDRVDLLALVGVHLDQPGGQDARSEEHTSSIQSHRHILCPLLLAKKKSRCCTAR